MITRKRVRWFLLITAIGLFAVPYLVNLDTVRKRIETRINTAMGATASIEVLRWRWFPSPGLALREIALTHPLGRAHIREAILFPDMVSLLKGSFVIRSIRIVEPDIRVESLDDLTARLHSRENGQNQPPKHFSMGQISVTVSKGRILAPWSGTWEGLTNKTPAPELTGMTLSVETNEDRLSIEARMASSYSGPSLLSLDLGLDKTGSMRWNLSVKAKTINYNAIRAILLHAYPEQHTVQSICGQMIPEGRIENGFFRFTGTSDQWKDISRMEVSAQVAQTVFIIPGSGLALTHTSGSLDIGKGILSCRNLSTSFGGSQGRNGFLSLDLNPKERAPFSLAMDLAADVSDLPPVLDAYLPDGQLKKELATLANLNGHADAKLTLSGDLPLIGYGLIVQNMSASCFLPRFNQPAAITKGALDLSPTHLAWTGLAADIGPQHIHNTAGRLDWSSDTSLSIGSLSASLDTGKLYPYLASNQTLKPKLEPWVSSVTGPLDIRSLILKGPMNNPKDWTFTGNLSFMGVTIESPQLPRPLTLFSPGVQITENTLDSRTVTASLGDQMLRLRAALKPGETRLDLFGTVKPSSATLIKSWIPDAVFPRLPCDLDPLTLTWTQGELALTGLVIHPDDKALPMTTQMDLNLTPSAIDIRDLSIDDGKQNARITAFIPRDLRSGDIHATLQGALDSDSLSRVIDNPRLPRGNISGEADLVYPMDRSKPPLLTGDIQITHLAMGMGENGGLTLSRGDLHGLGKQVSFDLEDLGLVRRKASPLTFQLLSGNLVLLPGPEADVSLTSGSICGIDLSGDILLPSLAMDMQFSTDPAEPLPLKPLNECLGLKDTIVTGKVTCRAEIQGTPDMIEQGRVTVHATGGVIQKDLLISKILALLDLTELFKANPVKNLLSDGYRYDSMDIEATITGHNMHVTRAQIIGAGINFFATGYVDLGNQSLDLTVLASPFKTVDSIVNHIPVVGKIIGGKNSSILSVPVKVEGHLYAPSTRILPKSLTQASANILDVFVKTFKLPFQLSSDMTSSQK